MQLDKDLQLIYITEVTKKDIMAGLNKMGNLYTNIKKPADEFVINLSGDFDYYEDVPIPENATPIEWKNLPAAIRLSNQFKGKLNESPGLFYTTEHQGVEAFFFFITDPTMKTLLREAFTADYPSQAANAVRDILPNFKPCKEWCDIHLGE